MPRIFALTLLAILSLASTTALAEMRLLMAENDGCTYCAKWNAEIAPIYPKTEEGRAAPLMRYNLRHGLPEGVELNSRIVFTPTFVLLQDGVEVARLEGYPGEDFFWGLLAKMLQDSPEPTSGGQTDTGS